jgi:hypothetical protein
MRGGLKVYRRAAVHRLGSLVVSNEGVIVAVGKINKIGIDYVGILVLGAFNAVVYKDDLRGKFKHDKLVRRCTVIRSSLIDMINRHLIDKYACFVSGISLIALLFGCCRFQLREVSRICLHSIK